MGIFSGLLGGGEEPSNEALDRIRDLKKELLGAIETLETVQEEEIEEIEKFGKGELNEEELLEHLEEIRQKHLGSFKQNMGQIDHHWDKLEGRENWPQDGSINVMRLWKGDGQNNSGKPPRERAKFVKDRLKEYAGKVNDIDGKIENLIQQRKRGQDVSREDLNQVAEKAEKTFYKFEQGEDDLAGYLDFSELEREFYD